MKSIPAIDKSAGAFFQDMPIPRFIVSKDESGAFVALDANKLAQKYFDMSAGQIVRHPLENFMSREHVMQFTQAFEVCYERGQAVTVQSMPKIPDSVHVYGFYISPVRDDAGKIEYLDVLGQLDLTDQGVLQRERDDALNLMTSIFEVSKIGIVITDDNGRIVRVNDGFIRKYGWSRDELINQKFTSFIAAEEKARMEKAHEEMIHTGKSMSGELQLLNKDGQIASSLASSSTLELSQGRRFQVTTMMDITERKEMERSLILAKDQADSANRAKSAFLANMSHELRTPMNAIIGFSEMIMNEVYGELNNDRYSEYIGDVHRSARHLLEIINEVLDMSKIEAGRLDLREEELDVADLLNTAVRIVTGKALRQSVSVDLEVPDKLPVFYGDSRLLQQAFINLITNAVKFSKRKTNVHVRAQMLPSRQIEVVVIDQGVGIPENELSRVLEPFGQVFHRAENSHDQGTGLGLPLAKAMIEMHGGTLRLESEVDYGTKAFVTLPADRVGKDKS